MLGDHTSRARGSPRAVQQTGHCLAIDGINRGSGG